MAPSVRLNPGWVSSISSSREKRPGMQSEWRSTSPVPSLRALHWIIWARSDSAEIARHCLPVKDDATRSSSSASTFAPTWSQGRVGEKWKKKTKKKLFWTLNLPIQKSNQLSMCRRPILQNKQPKWGGKANWKQQSPAKPRGTSDPSALQDKLLALESSQSGPGPVYPIQSRLSHMGWLSSITCSS